MASTNSRIRAWSGPAVFSYGFRPMFLLAGIWSAIAMAMWLAMLEGYIDPPIGWDGTSWHVHSMLFGYMGVVLAGFLLTAVPNWTGRLPVVGWPLAAFAGLWLAGLLAHLALPAAGFWLEPSFEILLAALLWREILAGNNRRNVPVAVLVSLHALSHVMFDWQVHRGEFALDGPAMRLGIAAIVVLISLIGGRVTPSFTRNWMVQRGKSHLPRPFGHSDRIALLLGGLALAMWVFLPYSRIVAALFLLAALAHFLRLLHWGGWRTLSEPLVTVLHAAYLFLPVGFVLLGLSGLSAAIPPVSGLHAWLAGAMGMMTLAVMTRAALGHTGRPLHAGPGIATIYTLAFLSALSRITAAFMPTSTGFVTLAAWCWIGAFALFVGLFTPILLRPRLHRRHPHRVHPNR